MTSYSNSAESRVYYMQTDNFLPDHVLYSDGCALKTLSIKFREGHNIAGNATDCGYAEGVGKDAKFDIIPSFTQLNSTHVLLADYGNHCIRMVDRRLNLTTTFVGECNNSGNANGKLLESRLFLPDELVLGANPNIVYLAVDESIKKIDIREDSLTVVDNFPDFVTAAVLGPDRRHLYIATSSMFRKINLQTGLSNKITEKEINGTLNFIFLNSDTVLAVQSDFNRLEIIDLTNSSVSTICNGNEGKFCAGDPSSCQIYQPLAVLLLDNTTVLVGADRITKLHISGLTLLFLMYYFE